MATIHRVALSLSAALVLCVAAAVRAEAHGGGSFRSPGGIVPPSRHSGDPSPPLPPPPPITRAAREAARLCGCARSDCPACALANAGAVSTRPHTTLVRRWGDLVELRHRLLVGRGRDGQAVEASTSIEAGSLFAVTRARVDLNARVFVGGLGPSAEARREYLAARPRGGQLLVLPESTGRVRLRARLSSRQLWTTLTVHGYAFQPSRRLKGVRLYRTRLAAGGARVLAVMPKAEVPTGLLASHVDPATDLALSFLSEADAKRWFGALAAHPVEVPCVPALECVVTGHGTHAVCGDTVLLALRGEARKKPATRR